MDKITFESKCKIYVQAIEEQCTLFLFKSIIDRIEIIALVRGNVENQKGVPLRIHSECFTGDILGSMHCDCGPQLNNYLNNVMAKNEPSMLLYIKGHEGRGIGLDNKIRAYNLIQTEGLDTIEANLKLGFEVDMRTYEECRGVLDYLKIESVKIYTNNQDKAKGIGIDIVESINHMATLPNPHNNSYLMTKKNKMSHETLIVFSDKENTMIN
jgi:GTP cyclohydrolase II